MTGGGFLRRGATRTLALARRYPERWLPLAPPSTSSLSSSQRFTPLLASSRRLFFSVPNYDEMCAKSFSSTKTVQHSPKNLFAVVADVDKYEEFVPFCVRSRVVRRRSDTRFEAELEIGFRLFNEKYVSDVTLVHGESVRAEAITRGKAAAGRRGGGSGLFERLVSTWKFKPGAHPNECIVNFDIDFRVGSVIHAQAVGLFFEEVSRMQINAFEERCDRLYGRGHREPAESTAVPSATATLPAPAALTASTPTEAIPAPWERRVHAAFEKAAAKSSHGVEEAEQAQRRSSITGGDDDDDEGSSSRNGNRRGCGDGLGLRDFARACDALEDVEPFAAVTSRPLLCGALHAALDLGGEGRVTAEEAVAAARLLRQDCSVGSGCVREVDAAELKTFLLDQLRALKRRMPHVARLASQRQRQRSQQPTGGGVSSASSSASSSSASSAAASSSASSWTPPPPADTTVTATAGASGEDGDGFEILLETATADVMVDQALEGAEQLARELFEALDVDCSGIVTGGEWAAAAEGHPGLLSPHTLDGILRLGVLTRQARAGGGGG